MAELLRASCLLPIPPSSLLLRTVHSRKTRRAAAQRRVRLERRGAAAAPVAQFALETLPFPLDALEPHLSKKAVELHWGKHHRAHIEKLNRQIENTDFERNSLEEIVTISYNNGNPLPVFNNAGQAWNHDFYWSSIDPRGGGRPAGELLSLLERDFGSFDEFVDQLKQAGASHFGSGWVWLVLKKKERKLAIVRSANALNPLIWGHIPLLAIDVWEHAYYLDFQDRRADYLATFVDNLMSWNAAEARLARAKAFVNLGEPFIPKV